MTSQNSSSLNVDALFIGPKSENRVFFKEMMEYAVSEHLHWRADFHPEDPALVTPVEQHATDFRQTLYRTEGILRQLSSAEEHLGALVLPALSGPHECRHADGVEPGLRDDHDVQPEQLRARSLAHHHRVEVEAGLDLCRMFGYDPKRGWGHITSGGTVANYEGMWVARNLKTIPLAIAQHEKRATWWPARANANC